jgi:hypothetical protein
LGGKRAETIKNLVSSTIGVQLKTTQARGIANEGRVDPTATAVNEFNFIEAYIQKLAVSDRAGTYKFKKEAGDDGDVFQYTFVAPGAARAFWAHCGREVIAVDATFLTGPLKGFLFAAVTKDANNELVLLSFGQMEKENGEMWYRFLDYLKQCFPGIKLILCDKQKGLDSCKNAYPVVRFGRCAKHLLDNAKDPSNKLGSITKDWELQFWGMVKAPCESSYLEALEAARALNRKAADWIDARKDEFAEHVYLREGIRRFGESTSNMAEEIFGAWSKHGLKGLPIIELHQKILVWASQKMHRSRTAVQNVLDAKPNATLTPWIEDVLDQKSWSSRTTQCEVISSSPFEFVGVVKVRNTNPVRMVEVKLKQTPPQQDSIDPDSWTASASCSCERYRALGRPCKHALSGLRVAAERGGGRTWNCKEKRWVHKVFHFASWQKQYSSLPFPITAVEFQESDRSNLLPPAMEKKRGKKAKKKATSQAGPPEKKRTVVCKGCGESGHQLKSCVNPDSARIARAYSSEDIPVVAKYEDDNDEDHELDPSTKESGNADLAGVVVRQINQQLRNEPERKVRRIVIELE